MRTEFITIMREHLNIMKLLERGRKCNKRTIFLRNKKINCQRYRIKLFRLTFILCVKYEIKAEVDSGNWSGLYIYYIEKWVPLTLSAHAIENPKVLSSLYNHLPRSTKRMVVNLWVSDAKQIIWYDYYYRSSLIAFICAWYVLLDKTRNIKHIRKM